MTTATEAVDTNYGDRSDPRYRVNTTVYVLDPSHSEIGFAVKHLMISMVKGNFRLIDFSQTPSRPRASCNIVIDENDLTRSTVEVSFDTAMVDTGVEERDNDLRSPHFLDVERYPTITFKSTGVEKIDDENWRIRGDLTILAVTREVELETEFGGRGPGANGAERIAFSATTRISRKDFGMTHNPLLKTGGVEVGDEVRISLELECTRFIRVMQTEEEWAAIEGVKAAELELEEANRSQDTKELERLIGADLVYYAGTGAAQSRGEYIASLRNRNTENGIRNIERTTQRAKDQNRGLVYLLTGLRVGEEMEYEVEYHTDVVLTNKLYAIQDSMPGEPTLPGPERHLRYVRAWRLEEGQWRLLSHRYIHALD